MARSRSPKKLGDVLSDLIERLGISGELADAEIVEAWAAIAGPEINSHTESAWMRGKKLFVKVTSPGRRQHLHMSRTKWRNRLNLELGGDVVEEIVFR